MVEEVKLVEWYRRMLTIRRYDEKRSECATEFPTPQQHPHFGQEAISVGSLAALRPTDFVLGTHRCIGHAIAKGLDLKRITAELYGKTAGYAGGRSGEMSFQSAEYKILASGVVGNTIPIASGIGLANRLRGTDQVCLCFFGDGAVNTGLFHEGLNLAAVWGCPVVFVCENNQFGLTTCIARTTRSGQLVEKAQAYGIPATVVDGMDVLAVYQAVSDAGEKARSGKGPDFIEALTYRFGGYNVYTDPNQGVGLYRTAEEVETWKARCPIATFKTNLVEQGVMTNEDAQIIEEEVVTEIRAAFEFARQSRYPSPDTLNEHLFYTEVTGPDSPTENLQTFEGTRELSLREAIREALAEEMQRDERVFILGEEVGLKGGIFGVTRGLMEKFGEERVRDTPVSEGAIIGAAVGAALEGMRPVPEIMIVDFIGCGGAMAIIFNELATIPYVGNGQFRLPVVIRIPCGSRYPTVSPGAHHNGCLDSWFTSIPGLKVVAPSTPYDAKGLLKTAIRDDNPVIFLEHKHMYVGRMSHRYDSLADMYPSVVSHVPEREYLIPFGVADVKREGKDVTVVATMMLVHKALKAAEALESEGIGLEVIDPRTLVPFDTDTILTSIEKTGRLLVVTEDGWRNGSGAGIVAALVEEAQPFLKTPIKRLAAQDVPIPYGQALEGAAIPQEADIIRSINSFFED